MIEKPPLPAFVWSTVQDDRVRPEHANIDRSLHTQGLVSESQRNWHEALQYALPAYQGKTLHGLHALPSLLLHDESYGRVDYAAIEYRMLRNVYGAIGPRAPKRKRRKRLAKKIKLRGGMLRTCGVVQSYCTSWPAMRGWFT